MMDIPTYDGLDLQILRRQTVLLIISCFALGPQRFQQCSDLLKLMDHNLNSILPYIAEQNFQTFS